VVTVRRLTKVFVADFWGNECTTYITGKGTARARHLVASISQLDKFLSATRFGTRANLGIGNGLFNLEAAFGFVFLFHFRALEWNVSRLSTQLARLLRTRRFGAMKNHLLLRNLRLNTTLGARTGKGTLVRL